MKNWSKLIEWHPQQVLTPDTTEAIQSIIQTAIQQKKKIRVVGSAHSFTSLCKVEDILVSLDKYQGIVHIDKNTNEVTVKAGTKIHQLNQWLSEEGLALENMGDIDVQSIAGAISTGTHGTGTAFGNLCTQITKIQFVNGLGNTVTCSPSDQPQVFKSAILSLGLLGVITEITFQCIPLYNLELSIKRATLEDVLNQLEDYNNRNRHFEFYWFLNTPYVMTKELNITTEKASSNRFREYIQEAILENYGFKFLCEIANWFPSLSRWASRVTAGSVSKFRKVKNSHKAFSTRRIVRFNEMEYNVPIETYKDVKKEITQWIDKHNKHIMFPMENRFVKGDDIFLSPAYQRNSAYIAVHAYNKKDCHQYFAAIEDIFKAYNGRPHWGKMHTQTAKEFQQLYPEFGTFKAIQQTHDPHTLFQTPYMDLIMGGDGIATQSTKTLKV